MHRVAYCITLARQFHAKKEQNVFEQQYLEFNLENCPCDNDGKLTWPWGKWYWLMLFISFAPEYEKLLDWMCLVSNSSSHTIRERFWCLPDNITQNIIPTSKGYRCMKNSFCFPHDPIGTWECSKTRMDGWVYIYYPVPWLVPCGNSWLSPG